MTVSAEVLFGRPQQEIASRLRSYLQRCCSASLVTGFATVAGMEAIADPICVTPAKLKDLVVGAGTWRAFDAMDQLLAAGVSGGALRVHLGHSLPTGTRKNPFHRYRPMLHSKVYLFDMGDGAAAAFVGSHNLTGFALEGKNGEAGVLLEGPSTSPQFTTLSQHVADATRQAVLYDPGMKDAYAWWTMQFFAGLNAEANNDLPRDAEGLRTIVVLSACVRGAAPRPGELIYFEIPEGLDRIESMRAEVHIYIFSHLPATASLALSTLGVAAAKLECSIEGIESGRGGIELRADWHIDDRRRPEIKRVAAPFRPTTASGMQQVRVKVTGRLTKSYEYLFDSGKVIWAPVLDGEDIIERSVPADAPSGTVLAKSQRDPRLDLSWQRVKGLERGRPATSDERELALWESTPESESFILFSLRRRRLSLRR